ncbi:MAG: DnaD domain protein [Bacilli bacterium]|nr:DnaD domain protein [Bacilli bacterium]
MEYIHDSFQVLATRSLHSEDMQSLMSVYLPIMGMDSLSVYLILTQLENKEVTTYKVFFNSLENLSLVTLNQALEKLEALHLIQSYHSEAKGYLHQIFPPLPILTFLEVEGMGPFLEGIIGEVAVQKLKDSQKSKVIGFKNISKSFTAVFKSSISSVQAHPDQKPSIFITGQDFNYTEFKVLMDSNLNMEAMMDTDDFKNKILRLAFNYRLEPEHMVDVVMKAQLKDPLLSYASLSYQAKYKFNQIYKINAPRLETVKEDQFIRSSKDDKWLSVIDKCEQYSISDMLYSLSEIKPASSEIKMFDDLSLNTKLSIPVINFMIYIVNKQKEGELPNYQYFEKIAQNWVRGKVKTVQDAIKLLEKKQESKETKPKGVATKKKVPVPEWHEAYRKQLKEKEQQKQQEDEIVELAKELFD